MNSTATAAIIAYDVKDKILLTLLGGIFVPFTSWVVFVIARHRLRLKTTLKSRAYLFYQVLAGVLVGQFMCHTWVALRANPVDAHFMFLFALLGYLLFSSFQTFGRFWNTNSNYNGPLMEDVDVEEYALDRETLEEQSVVIAKNVNSPEFADNMFKMLDYAKHKRTRNWMLLVVLVIFTVISVMDGLLLVYRNPQDPAQIGFTLLAFYLNGCAMTISVFGVALHAKWHVLEEQSARLAWWILLTIGWSLVLIGSAMPVVVGCSVEVAQDIISHPAFLAFYGLASGCVFGMIQYYQRRKLDNIERKEAFWGEVVFWLASGQAALTSFWL